MARVRSWRSQQRFPVGARRGADPEGEVRVGRHGLDRKVVQQYGADNLLRGKPVLIRVLVVLPPPTACLRSFPDASDAALRQLRNPEVTRMGFKG